MKELILSSTIFTGKIYCSKLTNNLLFVCKNVLKQSKKEFFVTLDMMAYHGYDDFTIDMPLPSPSPYLSDWYNQN